jgi:hypothetical protein
MSQSTSLNSDFAEKFDENLKDVIEFKDLTPSISWRVVYRG